MPIYYRCSCCNKRIESGKRCECLKKRIKKNNTDYDRFKRDRRSDAFYHSQEWINARAEALRTDSEIDVYIYMTTGEIVIADMVHHIEPLKECWERRVDIANLMSLNSATHSKIEKLYKENEEEIKKYLKEILIRYRGESTKF